MALSRQLWSLGYPKTLVASIFVTITPFFLLLRNMRHHGESVRGNFVLYFLNYPQLEGVCPVLDIIEEVLWLATAVIEHNRVAS